MLLYKQQARNWNRLARPERFELPTLWFEARYSIQLSYGRQHLLPSAEQVIFKLRGRMASTP
ncbi:hypothetical protein CCP4SC76_1770001 [Gammaproteobacteria bacterium]